MNSSIVRTGGVKCFLGSSLWKGHYTDPAILVRYM